MTAFVWVMLTLLGAVLGAELVAWCGPLQRALIRQAAAVLPKEQADRYIEEWYCELRARAVGPSGYGLRARAVYLSKAAGIALP